MVRPHRQKQRGFTLIELLVVIAIMGVLASIVMTSLNSARMKARDSQRLVELKELEKALALYELNNGAYPSTSNTWWGTCSSYGSHPTSGSTGWVPDLAPAYIAVLPTDPKPVGNNGCYLYRSNGTDYMLLAYRTVETHPTITTNPSPRLNTDGTTATCGSDSGYQSTFARYTPGAMCW